LVVVVVAAVPNVAPKEPSTCRRLAVLIRFASAAFVTTVVAETLTRTTPATDSCLDVVVVAAEVVVVVVPIKAVVGS